MIRLAPVAAVARAEIRLTRRLVRYWIIIAAASLLALLMYLQVAVIHGLFSSYSSTLGLFGPRFFISAVGFRYLFIFMFGIVFLAFDVRARDRRERTVEVLDSRPFTNLELVSGRFLGLLIVSWLPLVGLMLFLEMLGFALKALGSPVGEAFEPVSLFAYAFFMALPAFAFVLALVFLVTLVVRNRLVAAVLVLAIQGGLTWAAMWLPLSYGPFFDIWGAFTVDFPSDIIPGISNWIGWLQRLAVLIAGFGLLGLAAVIHPRLDGGPRRRIAAASTAAILAALALMAIGVNGRLAGPRQIEAWNQAHAARASEPVADIVSMAVIAVIKPAKNLDLDLQVVVRAPDDESLDTMLFTLNPGLDVSEIADDSGAGLDFGHVDGLLEIDRSLAAGQEVSLTMRIEGEPDVLFGYLDSVRNPENFSAMEGPAFLLGYERSIWDRRFVALMPGTRWLPAAGAESGRDDPRLRARDFYDIDLTVELPEGWLAAGPGRRQQAEPSRFRFAPGAPVHEVALIASRFESVTADVDGVRMELLVHRKHTRNIEALADSGSEVRTWIEEQLRAAADIELSYPYDGFTLVEVPTALRGYAGGWRLDTAMAPPTMVLMKESGFPTSRFDVAFRNPESFRDREGGMPRAMRDRLVAYFNNDFSGGNLFVGAARNFFANQTGAVGADAIPVNFALDELTTLLVTGLRGYFSAHLYDRDFGQNIETVMRSGIFGGSENVADRVIEAFASRPAVWAAVLDGSLRDLDPWENPQRALNALTLKGGALAQSLHDGLDRETGGRLLAELREQHTGETFDLEEVVAVGNGLEEDLGLLLVDWLTTTSLPGFVAEPGRLYRLPDADDGSTRYQLLVTLRNDETVPGLLVVHHSVGEGEDREEGESEPLRVPAESTLEYGSVLSSPPDTVWIEPYLSLNRESFRISLPEVDADRVVREEPFEGTREVEWVVPDDGSIAVDDLDEGFEVVESSQRWGLRLGGRGRDAELDDGLPIHRFGRPPNRWSRAESGSAWGLYRHTAAAVRAGKGRRKAIFRAQVPTAGHWELELHLPHHRRFGGSNTSWGTWKLEVIDSSGSRKLSFDADAGGESGGWSLVGDLDLGEGEVSVVLSDETDGRLVVADAIRWVPTGGRRSPAAPEIAENRR